MDRGKTIALTAAAVLAIAGVMVAQQMPSANRLKHPDKQFAISAAQGGLAEVQMGELALQHASNDAVKMFGQHMVDDHNKINDELKNIAGEQQLTLPADVTAKDKSTIEHLSTLNGPAFDRAYMRDMVTDHQEDIAEFTRESNNGIDPTLRAFAAKTLPTLQEHLHMARNTQGQLK